MEAIAINTVKLDGVELAEVKTFGDNRGFFREVARTDKPLFGEGIESMYQAAMLEGAVKDWTVQPGRVEWVYVPVGTLQIALLDLRENSTTKGKTMYSILGENEAHTLAKVPAGVACTGKALNGIAYVFYITGKGESYRQTIDSLPLAF